MPSVRRQRMKDGAAGLRGIGSLVILSPRNAYRRIPDDILSSLIPGNTYTLRGIIVTCTFFLNQCCIVSITNCIPVDALLQLLRVFAVASLEASDERLSWRAGRGGPRVNPRQRELNRKG